MTEKERIDKALDLAYEYGQTDGGHHKMWIIDQMVRALTGDDYYDWVTVYQQGDRYYWDVGIAP
jgi:hypothetical protein